MMGFGPAELVIILIVLVLLFGPTMVLAWFVWTMYRAGGQQPPRSAPTADAKDTAESDPAVVVARRRYAAGEITKEQFEEIKSTLGY